MEYSIPCQLPGHLEYTERRPFSIRRFFVNAFMGIMLCFDSSPQWEYQQNEGNERKIGRFGACPVISSESSLTCGSSSDENYEDNLSDDRCTLREEYSDREDSMSSEEESTGDQYFFENNEKISSSHQTRTRLILDKNHKDILGAIRKKES